MLKLGLLVQTWGHLGFQNNNSAFDDRLGEFFRLFQFYRSDPRKIVSATFKHKSLPRVLARRVKLWIS